MKQDLLDQLAALNAEISSVNLQIKTAEADAAQAPGAIAQIDLQIPIVDSRIADLQRQLAAAQAEKSQLVASRIDYNNAILQSKQRIASLNAQLIQLQSRIPGLNSQISAKQASCDQINAQLNSFRASVSNIDSNFQAILQKISAQQALVAEKKKEIEDLKAKIGNIPSEILSLQGALAANADSLNRQYYICNNAANAVKQAQQNLDAMNLKYTTETRYLTDANNNLEQARAEKELADIAVQEIISFSTNALPFSIVPNGQGKTPVGTPVGNNPAGNALGPVAIRNQIVAGSPVVVGDLSNYLSSAYGAGVDPARAGTVTTMFPLSTLTLSAVSGASESGVFNPDGTFIPGSVTQGGQYGGGSISSYLSNFTCGQNSGNVVTGQGRIMGVQPGMIRVQQSNGENVNLHVSQCSNLSANVANLTLVPFTNVYFKGTPSSNGNGMNLYQMSCVV